MKGLISRTLSGALLASLSSTMAATSPATNLPAPSPSQNAAPSVTLSTAASQKSSATALPLVTNTPSPTVDTNSIAMTVRELPEIHGRISIPKDWTLVSGKLLEGDVLLATREKISSENDPWITGLSMTIDRNGSKDSGQKASDYARSLAQEAREKAGEEASPIKESQTASFRELRFDFPISAEQPLIVTEVLRANDKTGTLAVILWQMPKDEVGKLQSLREAVLSGLLLDPAQ